MTGLEKILRQITEEAQEEADRKRAEAQAQADALLDQAKAKAAQAGKDVQAEGERRAQEIRDRATSAAELVRRNAMLAFKQEVIREALEKALAEMENAPAEEYFSLLVELAGKNARPGKAQLCLNQKDLDRLPEDFQSRLKAAAPQAEITVSREPAAIDSGFLLVYDGIDINCTFRALFEDAEGVLRDRLSGLLFPGKEPV